MKRLNKVVEHLGWSRQQEETFWDWICAVNPPRPTEGSPFNVSNWEMAHKNGKFLHFLKDRGVFGLVEEIRMRLEKRVKILKRLEKSHFD